MKHYARLTATLQREWLRMPRLSMGVSDAHGSPTDSDSKVEQALNVFHRTYYDSPGRTWKNTTWLGTPVAKCPLDLWIYQELLTRVRPDVILETETHKGGSAHYLASICDLLDNGRVMSVDI